MGVDAFRSLSGDLERRVRVGAAFQSLGGDIARRVGVGYGVEEGKLYGFENGLV